MEDPSEEAKRLLLHNTVKESQDYLYSLSRTIDESSHSLRSLIGDSEKDVLAACERMADMRTSSVAILAVQARVQRHTTTGGSASQRTGDNNSSNSVTATASSPHGESMRVTKLELEETEGEAGAAALATTAALEHVLTRAEDVATILHEGLAILRGQLINVEALLLAQQVVAACGAVKESQNLLEALRSIPRVIRASLMSAADSASTGTREGQLSPLSGSLSMSATLDMSWNHRHGANKPREPASTMTSPLLTGANNTSSQFMNQAKLIEASCTRAEAMLSQADREIAQYETSLLRALQLSIVHAASDAAEETIHFLSYDATRTTAGAKLNTESTDASSMRLMTARDLNAEERGQRYHRQQARRRRALAHRLLALAGALEGLTFSPATQRWLDSIATTGLTLAVSLNSTSTTPQRASPLFSEASTSPWMRPNTTSTTSSSSSSASPVIVAGESLQLLSSLRVGGLGVGASSGHQEAMPAEDNASRTSASHAHNDVCGDGPYAVLLRLVESAVLDVAAVCARFARQIIAQGDGAATAASSYPESMAIQRDFLDALNLPNSLSACLDVPIMHVEASTATTTNTSNDNSKGNNMASLASSLSSSSLPVVSLFLVAQSKFMYASFCDCLHLLSSPSSTTTTTTATNTTTPATTTPSLSSLGTHVTTTALLLNLDEETIDLDGDDRFLMDSTQSGVARGVRCQQKAKLARVRRAMWGRVSEGVRRSAAHSLAATAASPLDDQRDLTRTKNTNATTEALTKTFSTGTQMVLDTLLEAKQALLYAAMPTTRMSKTNAHAPLDTPASSSSFSSSGPTQTHDNVSSRTDAAFETEDAEEDEEEEVIDSDDDREEASVALQLAGGAAARAARRIRYVDFLLHATASVSACELVRYRASLPPLALDEETTRGVDRVLGTTQMSSSIAAARAAGQSAHVHTAALSPASLAARVRESQSNLLRPYATAVVALLGEGNVLLLGAYLAHELAASANTTTSLLASSSPSSSSLAMFMQSEWTACVVAALSQTITRSLSSGLACLVRLQDFVTQLLLDAASVAVSASSPSSSSSDVLKQNTIESSRVTSREETSLTKCTHLLRALELAGSEKRDDAMITNTSSAATAASRDVSRGRDQGSPYTSSSAAATSSSSTDVNYDVDTARQRLRFALARAQDKARLEAATVSSSSSPAVTLLTRLGAYSQQHPLASTLDNSETPSGYARVPRDTAEGAFGDDSDFLLRGGGNVLFTSLAAALSANWLSTRCSAEDEARTTTAAAVAVTDGSSPVPTKPVATASAAAPHGLDAEQMRAAQFRVAAFLLGLDSSASWKADSATVMPKTTRTVTQENRQNRGEHHAVHPYHFLRAWILLLSQTLAMPQRLRMWLLPYQSSLTTPSSSSSSSTLASSSPAAASLRILSECTMQVQSWLANAMDALRLRVKSERVEPRAADDRDRSDANNKDDKDDAVNGAVRAFELSRVALALYDAATFLLTALSSESSARSLASPAGPSLERLALSQREAQKLFCALHDPWRVLARQEAREAVACAYVHTTVQEFIHSFQTWWVALDDKTLATTHSLTPAAIATTTATTTTVNKSNNASHSTVWADGYRTAHGQRWRTEQATGSSISGALGAYPFLPSASLEVVSWQLEQILASVQRLAPTSMHAGEPALSSVSSSSSSPSSTRATTDLIERDVIQRVRHDLAEAAVAVADGVLLPALRTLPETILRSYHPASTATATGSAPEPSLPPRTEVERLTRLMLTDFWFQLYFDLSAWKWIWLERAQTNSERASQCTKDAATTTTTTTTATAGTSSLGDRMNALLRHCTLHGDSTRWAHARPLMDTAARTWYISSGVLHGSTPQGTTAPPNSAAAAALNQADNTKDALIPARQVTRFALLPIATSSTFTSLPSASAAGAATTRTIGMNGGAVPRTGGVGGGGGARRLANPEHDLVSSSSLAATGSAMTGNIGSAGIGYGQRYYAPPPPSTSSSGGGRGALFGDLPVPFVSGAAAGPSSSAGRAGLTGVQDAALGAAALWDQTQKRMENIVGWGWGKQQPQQ